jgi:serine/threonine protein kinase
VNDDDRADPSAPTVQGKARAEVDPFEELLREVAAAPTPPPSPWETLEQKRYRILALLGGGGGGQVYKAFDEQLGREVALKFLNSIGPAHTAQLVKEARTQARVKHPGICQVYEVVESVGRPFIAMQLIEGPTLGAAAAELSLAEKVTIMRLVAEAVEAAHQLGIVHRDLKPANVILERAPDGSWRPYVTDFGLARELDKTLTQGMVGTPNFMAPEQARGDVGAIGSLTDVWALGATLYQLLAGKPPFDGDSIMSILRSVELDEPAPLPEVPRDLQAIVFRCLEKVPAKRYPSAAALARDLAAFERGEPVAARRRGPWRRAGRVLRRFSLALVALLIVAAAAASFLLRPKSVWKPHIVELPPRYEEYAEPMSLSPDGKQLVFAARRGQTIRLYLQSAAGGAAQVLDSTDNASAPRFSSNGDAIYFVLEDGNDGSHIVRLPLHPPGPPVRLMEGTDAVECAGRLFVLQGRVYDRKLMVYESGGAQRELTRHEEIDRPACSRDGKRVAYMCGLDDDERVAWLSLDDGQEHLLPQLGEYCFNPSFVEDGNSLLIEVGKGDDTTLWEQRLDGSRARRITDGGQEKSPQLAPDRRLFFEIGRSGRSLTARALESGAEHSIGSIADWLSLSVMPDGRLLTSRWLPGNRVGIVLIDPTTDAETLVANGSMPEPSVDGRELYFAAEDYGSVWTMHLPDGQPRLLGRTPLYLDELAVGPDALHLSLANDRAWRFPYDGLAGEYEGPVGTQRLLPAADGWTVIVTPQKRAIILRPGPMPEALPKPTRFRDPRLTADRRAFVAFDDSHTIWRVQIATGEASALAQMTGAVLANLSPDGKTLYTVTNVRRTRRAVITNYDELPPL